MKTKAQQQRDYVDRCRKNNICPRCGGKTDDRLYCGNCNILRNKESRDRRKIRKKKGLCIVCGEVSEIGKTRCKGCGRKGNTSQSQSRLHDKLEALNAYGGCVCACCGFTGHHSFFAIDHKNNDGSKHRDKINVDAGSQFYYWLKKNNYPKNLGLQILCHSCNGSKLVCGGICAHKLERKTT